MQQDATGSEEGINNLNKGQTSQIYHGTDGFESFRPRSGDSIKLVIWLYCMTYRNPTPTVDIIIELVDRPHRPIILIERHNPPCGRFRWLY